MDTNTIINSNITMDEAAELAEVLTAEHDAHVVNDEIDAHVVNDEIDAYKINEDLSQVAETFDAIEAAGENVDTPSIDPERLKSFQSQMANYMSAAANHAPGKEFEYSDVTYVVQNVPHRGMWVRKEKKKAINQNMKNNSVRRKLDKNPDKYNTGSFTL